jgi:hypothetical protein
MAKARFFILGIVLILMSSAVLAVPLIDINEISDPLLLCDRPELYLDHVTLLDGYVIEGQEASFEACITNKGGPLYFPFISLSGAVKAHSRQGNLYNETRCFEFESKVYNSDEIEMSISYIMECEYITLSSYKIVYEGGVVEASIETPRIPVCENFDETLDSGEDFNSANLVSGGHSQLCTENNVPEIVKALQSLLERIIQLL